ncbi:MAG TPA: transglutaminase domain-containing protein, partial [Puia sp.]|nr:transglutaminase domain-containing protein [Puia sp.]
MRNKRLLSLLLSLFLLHYGLTAQEKADIKFGQITASDFDLSKHKFDSGASAVVIADIGNTYFEGNTKGDFSLLFRRVKRIKILNRNGFDAAQSEIMIYNAGGNEERLNDLKAFTYNLENSRVIQTKLDDKSIFTDKIDKYHSLKKFTMPAVKEGSIIEIAYTIKSDFYHHLRPWNFQGAYPCLWSEYEVSIPEFFNYVLLNRGEQSYFIKTTSSKDVYYTVHVSGGTEQDDIYHINGTARINRWVMKDVPALKEENFTTSMENYLSRIEFQLNYFQFGNTGVRHEFMGNWLTASEKLLQNEYFGAALDNDNRWMADDIKKITEGCSNNLDKIRKIYAFVRDNFVCSDYNTLYAENPLKTVFKKRNGNIAEINLLLVSMFRRENIDADPVILSTRSNGFANDLYPVMAQFNYVICAARDKDSVCYLDASRPSLGFNFLPIDCYNGQARIINKLKPFPVYFDSDSIREKSLTTILIINDEKGGLSGSYQSIPGRNIESYELRQKIKKKGEKEFFKDIQTLYGADLQLENTGIDSMEKLEEPVKVHFDFNLKTGAEEDLIYFNPMLSEGIKENPFKATERKYPVEMPYPVDKT